MLIYADFNKFLDRCQVKSSDKEITGRLGDFVKIGSVLNREVSTTKGKELFVKTIEEGTFEKSGVQIIVLPTSEKRWLNCLKP